MLFLCLQKNPISSFRWEIYVTVWLYMDPISMFITSSSKCINIILQIIINFINFIYLHLFDQKLINNNFLNI